MVQDHIWTLIAKKLSGEANEEELRNIEQLLRENPDLHYPLQTVIDLWFSDLKSVGYEAPEALKRHIQRMKDLNIDFNYPLYEEGPALKTSWINKKFLLWSGLALTVFTVALFLGNRATGINSPASQNLMKEPLRAISQISTKNGFKTNLILPDGSKV